MKRFLRTIRPGAWPLPVAVFLLLLTGCETTVKTLVFQNPKAKKIFTPPKPDHNVSGRGWTNSVGEGTNTITVLHVSGTNYYSFGYHHGKLLGPQVKEIGRASCRERV